MNLLAPQFLEIGEQQERIAAGRTMEARFCTRSAHATVFGRIHFAVATTPIAATLKGMNPLDPGAPLAASTRAVRMAICSGGSHVLPLSLKALSYEHAAEDRRV